MNFIQKFRKSIFFNELSFRSNVVSIKLRFGQVSFRSSVVSIKCRSVKCRFDQLSGHDHGHLFTSVDHQN